MSVQNQMQLREYVLEVMARTTDPRLREILVALARHLHTFIEEVKLTEREFQQAIRCINALGQQSSDSHNEAMLMAGSLGLSMLVCLLNNGRAGHRRTSASLLGPFWRAESPRTESGASIVRSPTPGPSLFVHAQVLDIAGSAVTGAEVDVWQSAPTGLYENQDPTQVDMNLRGRFTTDDNGRLSFRSVMPAPYPVPTGGLVGDLLRAQDRHPYRPAHLHALIHKPGYKTISAQIYVRGDPYLDSDVQFGVADWLIGDYQRHDAEPPPALDVVPPWYTLNHTFVIEPGEARLPIAPIRAGVSQADAAKRRRPRDEPLRRPRKARSRSSASSTS